MKNTLALFFVTCLLTACGRTDKAQDSTPTGKAAQGATDSVATTAANLPTCQSVVKAGKLGKADEYRETAKSITVAITLEQDSSSVPTAKGCYYNNTVTVLATKKSGNQVFRRTLLKDDLAYFTKDDHAIEQSVLQTVTYKPTFNSQRYITLNMHLLEPDTRQTLDYTVFMNYFGEIVKVK